MSRALTCAALALSVLVSAAPAEAQMWRPGRPYRGLFASGVAETGQMLAVSATIGAGYDDDLVADFLGQGTARPDQVSRGGVLGQFSGGVMYSADMDRISFNASTGMSGRYYPDQGLKMVRGFRGQASLGASLTQRTSLSAGVSFVAQPYMFDAAMASLTQFGTPDSPIAEVPDLDLALNNQTYTSVMSSVGVSHQYSQRLSQSVSFAYRVADDPYNSGTFIHRTAGTRLSYSVSKDLGVRTGYGYSDARYGDGRTRDSHVIDAGVDYNRGLSLTRRTTLGFSTGSTALAREDSYRFHVTGAVELNHEIGRTWRTFISYGRRVQFSEVWQEPVTSAGLTTGISGLLSRQLQFTAFARGSMGNVGVERSAPGFDTVHAGAVLSYGINRFISAGLTYAYYRHRYDEAVVLPVGIPSTVDRHSIRAGVSLWAPLMQRTRRN